MTEPLPKFVCNAVLHAPAWVWAFLDAVGVLIFLLVAYIVIDGIVWRRKARKHRRLEDITFREIEGRVKG